MSFQIECHMFWIIFHSRIHNEFHQYRPYQLTHGPSPSVSDGPTQISSMDFRTCWWPFLKSFLGLFSFLCSNWNFESQKFWMNNEKLYTFVIKKNFCTHQRSHRSMLVLYGNPVWVYLVPSRFSVTASDKGQSAEHGPELEIKSSYCYCPHPSEFWRSIFVFNHPGWMIGGGLNHKGRHFNFHFPLIQTPTMAPSK